MWNKGPYLMVLAGVALVALAVYIAGTDQATCRRQVGQIDCSVERFRLLGLAIGERLSIPDVVEAHVATTTSSQSTRSSTTGRTSTKTVSNNTLILTTRRGEEVQTLGGGETFRYASQVNALVRNRAETGILLVDSYWPMAGVMAGLGLFIIVFGSVIVHFVNEEAMRADIAEEERRLRQPG